MTTLEELQRLVRDKYRLEPSALDPTASMRKQGLDSLAVADFLFEVEEKLGLSLPEAIEQVDTLAGLAELIDRVRAKQAA
jgi:acyl carrier protein